MLIGSIKMAEPVVERRIRWDFWAGQEEKRTERTGEWDQTVEWIERCRHVGRSGTDNL